MQIDPLSDVLSLLTPHTYVAGGFDLAGRWSISFRPVTGIKCYAVFSGSTMLFVDGVSEPLELEAGDCVLLPNGQTFRFANDADEPPVPFEDLSPVEWRGGIATYRGGGECSILGGHFAFADAHADLLLGAMPSVVRLRDGDERSDLRWALMRMTRELTEARPGGVLVAQHLAHLLLVQALRLYLEGEASNRVGWLFALSDAKLSHPSRRCMPSRGDGGR